MPGSNRRIADLAIASCRVRRAAYVRRVSEPFLLRDFLAHDPASVRPKYIVLREEPFDKLELVITEQLQRSGVLVRHLFVGSGLPMSHSYGDASDVFVDNDRDGHMDDLNHDSRVDARDTQVLVRRRTALRGLVR